MYVYVSINPNSIAHNNQHVFFSNAGNKSQFIDLLKDRLKETALRVHQSQNDADTLIVKVAIKTAQTGQECAVVADDTDVLVLLVHYFELHMPDIYFVSEASKRSKEGMKIRSVR